ncbi:P-type conjugative transfer protein TrbL [Roseibium aggregatum]|uniref:P-type conjugative transfer protein TrbL n=1 Tax=Roseibium aggregatum TaxID=187304 RepID=A0A926S8X9_9HYPH|nr:P-type conjugative transfer protein TrbL [Roseibium aggregatum]MBD1549502.1 P-type conjugative transfer protein TrbL [Roseibium aggregatum]
MNDLSIIDRFMETYSQYIDTGFGLLSGDVAFLSTSLIGIDITLAGLFWALNTLGGGEDNIVGRLLKKVLYVGAFAFIINNFQTLADIIYRSFAGLGLQAAPGGMTAGDLLLPGKIAATGYQAAYPLLEQVSDLVGFPEIFGNALTVFVLLVAWFLVLIAFFILAIQLFITVLEFKLTTLAGFVLVPFALWNKSAFLAERVLGNVISAGIKVMVLAVIAGIGSTLFSTFTAGLQGQEPDLAAAMSQVLGALSLLGLGIFGPGIAAGLVSGAPQLGAGSALGTAGAAAGAIVLAGGTAVAATRLATGGSLAAIRAGASMGSAASGSFQLGQAVSGASGLSGVAAGMGGMARAAGGAVMQGARSATDRKGFSFSESFAKGTRAAWTASGGTLSATMQTREDRTADATSASTLTGSAPGNSAPNWAKRLRSDQTSRASRHAVAQAIKDGDRPSQGANPSIDQKDD